MTLVKRNEKIRYLDQSALNRDQSGVEKFLYLLPLERLSVSIRTHVAIVHFLALIIIVSMASSPTAAQDQSLDGYRAAALNLVNKARAKEKLPGLIFDPKLTEAAQFHAADMLKRNFYAHESPEGKTVSHRFEAAGGSKWLLTAENIAKCDGCKLPLTQDYVRQMHEGWINSPGHRANILRQGLESFGYGLALDETGVLYAVQTFSGPGTSIVETGAIATPLNLAEQAQFALKKINEKRRSSGLAVLEPSQTLNNAAVNILPVSGDPKFLLRKPSDLYNALPDKNHPDWASLTLLNATCGGCGVEMLSVDIEYFTTRWLEHPKYRGMLMSGEATSFGFAMAGDNKGRKIAIGVLGERR